MFAAFKLRSEARPQLTISLSLLIALIEIMEVRSEGILIKWKKIIPGDADYDEDLKKKFDGLKLTGEGAICWQNIPNMMPDGSGFSP
ncbi:MAG: hypothetical protein LAO78_10325 [Acidobacteriia bacterium]|nr:hypothetical protein [Terriglobia bacterium]